MATTYHVATVPCDSTFGSCRHDTTATQLLVVVSPLHFCFNYAGIGGERLWEGRVLLVKELFLLEVHFPRSKVG